MNKLRDYKTDRFTLKSGHIDVGDGHKVYYEQWGNPGANVPILMFHGGPGYRYSAKDKYIFDPKVHQVIAFDQRGAGNSLPYGKTDDNTTDDLISDSLKILELLKINKVYLYGRSWGSTLALLFSIRHQSKVVNTVVQGVFTGSNNELDYIHKGLFAYHFPEVWEKAVNSVPEDYKSNPAMYHYEILAGKDEGKYADAAKALAEIEGPLLKLIWQGYEPIEPDPAPESTEIAYDYVPYRLFAHYFSNKLFLEDDFILKNANKIKSPLRIVQGRYDMICPPVAAYELHKIAPGSKLYMTNASHAMDPENRTALKTLIDTVFI